MDSTKHREEYDITTTGDLYIHQDDLNTYAAPIFVVISTTIVLTNVICFVLYQKFGIKTVHGFFVMTLCLGNSLIGCSTLLSIVPFYIGNATPYICAIGVWSVSWGILFNIAMTFWICLERFIIVTNIPSKGVVWMQRGKIYIVLITGTGFALYLSLLFLGMHNNNTFKCDGIHVFGPFYPYYSLLMSLPLFFLLIVTIVIYKKTLYKLSTLMKLDNRQIETQSSFGKNNKHTKTVFQTMLQTIAVNVHDSKDVKCSNKGSDDTIDIPCQCEINDIDIRRKDWLDDKRIFNDSERETSKQLGQPTSKQISGIRGKKKISFSSFAN